MVNDTVLGVYILKIKDVCRRQILTHRDDPRTEK